MKKIIGFIAVVLLLIGVYIFGTGFRKEGTVYISDFNTAEKENVIKSENGQSVNELIQYYNDNFADKKAIPFFVDIDNDDQNEMIVIVIKNIPEGERNYSIFPDTVFNIYDYDKNAISNIYSDETNKRYSLIDDAGVIKLLYGNIPNDAFGFEEDEQFVIVSFLNGNALTELISDKQYYELLAGSIDLNESQKAYKSNRMVHRTLTNASEFDFSSSEIKDIVYNAKVNNEIVKDICSVSDQNGKAIYATCIPVPAAITSNPEYANVYASYDKKINLLNKIELLKEYDEEQNIYGYGVYDFGDNKHYYIDIAGVGTEYQCKYGYSNNELKLLDDTMEFVVINDTVYCNSIREWGNHNYANEFVEITFEEGQYKQYYSVAVDENDMSHFINYDKIIDECKSDIFGIRGIQLNEYEATEVSVNQTEMHSILKGSNNKYYITFSINATDMYMDNVIYDMYVYYTFTDVDNRLVREETVNYVEKLNTSEVNIAYID